MRTYLIAIVATAGIVAAAAGPKAAGSAIPTVDTFRDDYTIDTLGNFAAWTDRIRSDSGVPGTTRSYRGGTECVRSDVSGGALFVRTATNGCSPYTRALTVDFSDPISLSAGVDCSGGSYLVPDAYGDPGTLNICGSNSVPDARLIASDLFGRTSANGTPLTLVLNLAPDFRHNEFLLEFEQNQPITVVSPTTRTLTGSTLSIADLYRVSGTNKKTLLGQYRMPFQVTVQE
jgi:hypothetical protein